MIWRSRPHTFLVACLLCSLTASPAKAFSPKSQRTATHRPTGVIAAASATSTVQPTMDRNSEEGDSASISISEATQTLSEWDRLYSVDPTVKDQDEHAPLRSQLPAALRVLNDLATLERNADSTNGRVMLGICASTSGQGLATLKSWVDGLGLPRGLLHGMDKDGQPLDIEGGVYIKYNTGGSLTFSEMRQSGAGFDALWRPGDALLEPYDGKYRGVYFQVELNDDAFRQFLVPLDTFGAIEGV